MTAQATASCDATEPTIEFGPFRVLPSRRLLLLGSEPVRVSSRAFDVLVVLLNHAGRIVDKRQLLSLVWPDRFVDETNIRVHITALRHSLGAAGTQYIRNVPGQGYTFTGNVKADHRQAAVSARPARAPEAAVPVQSSQIVGRQAEVHKLLCAVSNRRLVTITGPGGVGKSRLAQEVFEHLMYADSAAVRFIRVESMGSVADLVLAIGSAVGVSGRLTDPDPSVSTWLGPERLVIILDNCDQIAGSVAGVCELVLARAPGVRLLVTSREPLGAREESLLRLRPLDTPKACESTSVAQALGFPSVQLFAQRAATASLSFELTNGNVQLIGEICRRLDGVPLALEIAAAGIDHLGVEDVANRLTDRLLLSMRSNRKTGLAHHKSLRDCTRWSFERLNDAEKAVLRRVSVIPGTFSVDVGVSLSAVFGVSVEDAFHTMMSLAAKSLVASDTTGARARLRLLRMTRAYSLEQLEESGEADPIAHRHGLTPEALLASLDSAPWQRGERSSGIQVTSAPISNGLRLALTDQ